MPTQLESVPSRDRLLDAAKRLFAAHGYEQTATSAIARQAGTSESQLMRYFGGKAGLLDALFEEAWVGLNARVDRAIEQAARPLDALSASLQSIVHALARDPDLAVLFLFEGRRLRGDEPRVRMSRGFQAFAESMRDVVRRAQASREISPQLDAIAVTSAIVGAAEALIRDRLLARSSGTRGFPEREIGRTLDTLLAGLARVPRTRRATRATASRARAARR